ncbi:hypothetical protein [Nocardioides litoris]|uniref:hypothetical protein n=1 Tax=Nocardioides litoris TaxID=1926648 RepID=UPI0011233838|nr:hypothetical protein [Nocardioides litoris]
MRFTERELTAAMEGAAKSVFGAQDRSVRKRRRTVDEAWRELTQHQRYTVLAGLGDQLLPVLVTLPDVPVEPGTRPTFTDAQVEGAVRAQAGDGAKGVRGTVMVKARVALVQLALSHVPPRADPDALVVPDHL